MSASDDTNSGKYEGTRSQKRKYKFQRALIACDQCRKAKTRCNYLTDGLNCFRCKNLSLNCSLTNSSPPNKSIALTRGNALQETAKLIDREHDDVEGRQPPKKRVKGSDERLNYMENKLEHISNCIDLLLRKNNISQTDLISSVSPPISFETPIDSRLEYQPIPSTVNSSNGSGHNSASTSASAEDSKDTAQQPHDPFFHIESPYNSLKTTSSQLGMPFSKELAYAAKRDLTLQSIIYRYDIISRNIVTFENCVKLVSLCLKYYGEWISVMSTTDDDCTRFVADTRLRSPLLLAICTLLGLRHCDPLNEFRGGNKNLEFEILQIVQQLFSLTTYELPQPKEFMQSMVLITNYSMSLSFEHIYFDGWWVSSYGLIQFVTREMNVNLFLESNDEPEKIGNFRLWNHLSLNHLMYCISSGRPCMMDELRLDQCRNILDLADSTTFDGTIVAELSIVLSLYNCLQYQELLSVSEKELNSTFRDWEYLTEQKPNGDRTSMMFKFSKVMIYRRYIFQNRDKKELKEYQSILKKLIKSCDELITFGEKLDKVELIKLPDSYKFSFVTVATVLLNLEKMKIVKRANDHNAISSCITKIEMLLKWIDQNINYYNSFISSYIQLISQFKRTLFADNPLNSAR
ncbi:hypothetical protein CANARDRAFT_22700 [[Candida] arabinofermentans NRRL YB-2248]|uniref:Zn(2)-C6 fungal-type domain-containing protein n=1 Tax=[Candida] arabinofermentans NRRL YB-2248 TaxID=983967 RepID=A0A1E4T2D6_9ASCO|nr:hypothetical protein CANARDRAFT_22700 [[Candida] arabinofermentans NRRL YB-2248]